MNFSAPLFTYVRDLLQGFSALIFPNQCLECHIDIEDPPLCNKCVSSLERRRGVGSLFDLSLVSAFDYSITASHLILAAKEENNRAARKFMAEHILSVLNESGVLKFSEQVILIPMPSSKLSERRRGYRHCYNLASELRAKAINNEGFQFSICEALEFSRPVLDQTELNFEARHMNMVESMRVRKLPELRGAGNKPPSRIVLIDDVATSGATLKEALRALREHGLAVDLLAVAAISPRLKP